MERTLLKIGDFAKRAGTNLRTLRYYEELDLIQPAMRSEGGFRYYSEDQLERMAAIRRLQQLGLALKEIQGYMVAGSASSRDEAVDRVDDALARQADLLRSRIEEMQADLTAIDRAREKLQECRACKEHLDPRRCDPCGKDHEALPAVLKALL